MDGTDPFDTRSPYEQLEIARRTRLVLVFINSSFFALIPFVLYVGVRMLPASGWSEEGLIVFGLSFGTIPSTLVARWCISKGRLTLGSLIFLFYFILLISVNSTNTVVKI